jgi:hypothetical protein
VACVGARLEVGKKSYVVRAVGRRLEKGGEPVISSNTGTNDDTYTPPSFTTVAGRLLKNIRLNKNLGLRVPDWFVIYYVTN